MAKNAHVISNTMRAIISLNSRKINVAIPNYEVLEATNTALVFKTENLM